MIIKNALFYIVSDIIGLITAYGGLADKKILFITSPRSAAIVLTVIGFLMCSLGALGTFLARAPFHPLTIAGYILGAMALFAGIVQIFKLNVPFLGNPRSALIFIAAVILIKLVIGRIVFLLPVK